MMARLGIPALWLLALAALGTPLAAQDTGAPIGLSATDERPEDTDTEAAAAGAAEEEAEDTALIEARAALVVRLSDELQPEARAAALAVIAALPGVVVGESATHEIGPRPSFREITALYEIPGAIARTPFSAVRNKRGIADVAELFEFYGGLDERFHAIASTIPPPLELGDAGSADFAPRLRDALLGLARQGALIKLARSQPSSRLSLCLSNEAAWGGSCPLPQDGRFWNEVVPDEPFFLKVETPDLDAPHFAVFALARDGTVRLLATGEATRYGLREVDQREDGVQRAVTRERLHYTPEGPLNDRLPPGFHDLLVIAAKEPLPYDLHALAAAPPAPGAACPQDSWSGLCEALQGRFDPSWLAAGSLLTVEAAVSRGYLPVRIVRGQAATRSVSLWQAQLLRYRRQEVARGRFTFRESHSCGGAYLGDGFVLTAAHCIPTDVGEMRVRLGSRRLIGGGETFPVRSVVVHTDGSSKSARVDLALLRLQATQAELDRLGGELQPIRLATDPRRRFSAKNALTATGWGLVKGTLPGERGWRAADGSRNSYPDRLQQARLTQVDITTCTAIEQFSAYRPQDTLCLRGLVDGADTCLGDSGGPVTSMEGTERRLVGIVSTGVGCAYQGMPGVYVNVAEHRGWIERARARLLKSREARQRME